MYNAEFCTTRSITVSYVAAQCAAWGRIETGPLLKAPTTLNVHSNPPPPTLNPSTKLQRVALVKSHQPLLFLMWSIIDRSDRCFLG